MDTADKPQSVLRIVVDNMIYPITVPVIHKVSVYILFVISLPVLAVHVLLSLISALCDILCLSQLINLRNKYSYLLTLHTNWASCELKFCSVLTPRMCIYSSGYRTGHGYY